MISLFGRTSLELDNVMECTSKAKQIEKEWTNKHIALWQIRLFTLHYPILELFRFVKLFYGPTHPACEYSIGISRFFPLQNTAIFPYDNNLRDQP